MDVLEWGVLVMAGGILFAGFVAPVVPIDPRPPIPVTRSAPGAAPPIAPILAQDGEQATILPPVVPDPPLGSACEDEERDDDEDDCDRIRDGRREWRDRDEEGKKGEDRRDQGRDDEEDDD